MKYLRFTSPLERKLLAILEKGHLRMAKSLRIISKETFYRLSFYPSDNNLEHAFIVEEKFLLTAIDSLYKKLNEKSF